MTAMKGCWKKVRNGTMDKLKLRFRSRKKCSESFHIRRWWIMQTQNKIILKLPRLKKIELWTGQRAWHGDIVMDCKLQRTWTNEYYLCVRKHLSFLHLLLVQAMCMFCWSRTKTSKNWVHITKMGKKRKLIWLEVESLPVCALDPGVRTFQTVYDVNDGHALQVGDRDMDQCFGCVPVDVSTGKGAKIETKIKTEACCSSPAESDPELNWWVHKQLAVHLAMIPMFEVSQMIRKLYRKITSKTAHQNGNVGALSVPATYDFQMWSVWVQGCCCQRSIHHQDVKLLRKRQVEPWRSKDVQVSSLWSSDGCDVNGVKNIFLRNYEPLGISVSSIGVYPLLRGDSQLHGKSAVVERQRWDFLPNFEDFENFEVWSRRNSFRNLFSSMDI